ncbi:RNase H domain-containing protein [Trichonephila clavata]|uniref:RNase H domain-containing protein n=1 Tax=Trichonephila clavata TaxID=2740835 RepID=A0A8X6L2F3_TRICU|nr:RNase H domain-containing protein [Trichonephila clavata]
MKTNTEEFRYRFRNPDNSSVFRSELVAIREALNLALDNRAPDTLILTDSKSSIQFLKDWSNVLDMLEQNILSKLAELTQVMPKTNNLQCIKSAAQIVSSAPQMNVQQSKSLFHLPQLQIFMKLFCQTNHSNQSMISQTTGLVCQY